MLNTRPRISAQNGSMSSLARAVLVLLALLVSIAARTQDLQIIELQHRQADDILPIVTPLLEPGGVLTGADNQLFVRTSPANFAQIQSAVKAVDRALRQLRITVSQGTRSDIEAIGARGSGTIGNDDVSVSVNRPPGSPPGVELEAGAGSQTGNVRNLSTVTTVEGSETFISVGQSVPVRTTTVTPRGNGQVVQQTTTYRDIGSGFYGTARINGDTVVLEISPQQQRYRPEQGKAIESRGMTSIVTGRLGEWMELGAVTERDSGSSSGILVWGRRNESSEYTVWVQVQEAP